MLDSKAKREAATADALAKAKAMVEAEQKKSIKSEHSVDDGDVATTQKTEPLESDTKTSTRDSRCEETGEVQSKKRAREEEGGGDGAPPEAKKVDTKLEPVVTNGHC